MIGKIYYQYLLEEEPNSFDKHKSTTSIHNTNSQTQTQSQTQFQNQKKEVISNLEKLIQEKNNPKEKKFLESVKSTITTASDLNGTISPLLELAKSFFVG
ncbi:hypothetical protein K9L27_01515 [Candidatus Gracilibacteria bacterium]|nr:hypothetical protein [Candidatus Gracilibacteria bacterium]